MMHGQCDAKPTVTFKAAGHHCPLAMGNKQMCGSADVATGKRWIKSADAKCGCVGKRQMRG